MEEKEINEIMNNISKDESLNIIRNALENYNNKQVDFMSKVLDRLSFMHQYFLEFEKYDKANVIERVIKEIEEIIKE